MSILTILIGGLAAVGAAQPGALTMPARQISGSISNADYPASAIRANARGTTIVTLAIGVDGRVTGCLVSGSSGNAALDSTTCSLAQRRFRFQPATRGGRPVPSTTTRRINWTPPLD